MQKRFHRPVPTEQEASTHGKDKVFSVVNECCLWEELGSHGTAIWVASQLADVRLVKLTLPSSPTRTDPVRGASRCRLVGHLSSFWIWLQHDGHQDLGEELEQAPVVPPWTRWGIQGGILMVLWHETLGTYPHSQPCTKPRHRIMHRAPLVRYKSFRSLENWAPSRHGALALALRQH